MAGDRMTEVSEYLAKIGRQGGKSKSAAKGRASAENGKAGGRPRGKNFKPRKRPKPAR